MKVFICLFVCFVLIARSGKRIELKIDLDRHDYVVVVGGIEECILWLARPSRLIGDCLFSCLSWVSPGQFG